MKTWHKAVAWLVGIGVIGGLGYIIASGQMTTNLAVGVLTTLGVVLAAVVTQMLTKQREIDARQFEQRREIESRHFEEKRAIYDELLSVYSDVLRQSIKALGKPRKQLSEQQIAAKLFDLKRKVLLWSDRDVIVWWLEQSETGRNDATPSATEPLLQFDRLILAMRDELGKDNTGMEPGDLISMFLLGGREELRKALE